VAPIYGVVALLAAVASLTVNFGLVDLIDGLTGVFAGESARVLDTAWGALFGVALLVGLLASRRTAAGLQQVALVWAGALTFMRARAWGRDYRFRATASTYP
jgi:hypothetical protein